MTWIPIVLAIVTLDLCCLYLLATRSAISKNKAFWAMLIIGLPGAGAIVFLATFAATRDLIGSNSVGPLDPKAEPVPVKLPATKPRSRR